MGVIAVVLSLLVASTIPQDTGMLDVPVYRNEAYGVALPRPFDDWVFSAGQSRRTTTVLFHPRHGLLRDQLWGALLLTTFDGAVPLNTVADQRVQETWQAELGRTFGVLTRDSLTVSGHPAIHIVMSGAVNRLAVDVEEYIVARGHDLIVLQFRYPRGLPRDTIAAGYERSFTGLVVRPSAFGAPALERAVDDWPAPADAAQHDAVANRALHDSPWRPRAYEALVRFDPSTPRLDVTVRLEIVNGDLFPRDTVVVALRWPFTLDALRSVTGQLLSGAGPPIAAVLLPQRVEPEAATTVSVSFHLDAAALSRGRTPPVEVTAEGAHCLVDWLPAVQPWADTAGALVASPRARVTTRFEMPDAFAVVAAGRLAVDFAVADRRRVTWIAEGDPPPMPAFVVGRLRRVAVRAGSLVTLRVWASEADSANGATRAEAVADHLMQAWAFYSRAFGRLPIDDVDVVLSAGTPPSVAGATLFLSPSTPMDSVLVATARIWWGETVRFAGPAAHWLGAALPGWSALAFRAFSEGDSVRQRLVREGEVSARPERSLEAARRAIGDAAFRLTLRTLFLEHRRRSATADDLVHLLGPVGASALSISETRQYRQ